MPKSKRIVCLANSRKLAGRCIAGREWLEASPGGWIRPVSAREHQEVSEYERQYQDGSDPRVLDVLDVPVLEPKPEAWQTENWLLDPDEYWEKVGQVSPKELADLVDPVEPLWVDGHHTFNGRHDKIPMGLMADVSTSLRLIHVPSGTLRVFAPGDAFGNTKRRVQCKFRHAGTRYAIWVTDPNYERRHLAMPDGAYPLGASYLTLSIGEPYGDACYKLVAAIVEDPEK